MGKKAKESAANAAPAHGESPLVSNQKLKDLYATMLKCRMIHERAGKVLGKKAKSLARSAAGHEAAVVATALDLRPEDFAALTPDNFAINYIKSVPLNQIFGWLYYGDRGRGNGTATGHSWGSAAANVLTPGVTPAAHFNMAVRIALAHKAKKNDHIAMAFSSPGVGSLAPWKEALTFAGEHQLPIIFVVQRDATEDPAIGSTGYGYPSIPVDGSDVVAVYRVAQESIERARRGSSPTLIECVPVYNGGKSKPADPIDQAELYLTRKGLFSEKWKQTLIREFSAELDKAVKTAKKMPPPPQVECLDRVYDPESPAVSGQRDRKAK